MENHEIFLQCDKLFSSNLSHSCTVRFGLLEWYKLKNWNTLEMNKGNEMEP